MMNKKQEYFKKYYNENKDKFQEYSRKYYKNNKNKVIKRTIQWQKDNYIQTLLYDSRTRAKKYNYKSCNATVEELEKSLVDTCQICGAEEKLYLDHCHKTGNFRGWLCHNCNLGLGYFNNSIEILSHAKKYLAKF